VSRGWHTRWKLDGRPCSLAVGRAAEGDMDAQGIRRGGREGQRGRPIEEHEGGRVDEQNRWNVGGKPRKT